MESDFFSIQALSRAVETRDSVAMRGFYKEDAQLCIIDRDHPPSQPQKIAGRSAIAAYFDDVCGRPMTHKLEKALLDGERLAFTQACIYPDGTRVFCAAMADLRDGQIASQTIVQAWDA